MKRRFFIAGGALVVVTIAGLLALLGYRNSIVGGNAHNILGIVESSLMQQSQDQSMQDSLRRDFLVIHEKVRTEQADSAGLRRLVQTFYRFYGDGRIDSVEARTLRKDIEALAKQ